jgi:glycerophosphoryl diester phosphodiesterase
MLIIAHRGHSAGHPENSPAAFAAAIACGADLIETDVRLTRDGVAVCCHDPDLQRLAGKPLVIAESAHPELAAALLSVDRQLMTLDAVLAIAHTRARVMLDVKVRTNDMAAAIVATLTAAGLLHDTVYGVRDPAQYAVLRRLAPQLSLLAMPPAPDALPDFIAAGVTAVRLWEHEVTPARIARIRDTGRSVWVTAGLRDTGEMPGQITAERLLQLDRFDIDAVLVNDPAFAAATLHSRPALLQKVSP